MEDRAIIDYPLYRAGCHKLGWTPLPFEEFRRLYTLYREAKRSFPDPVSTHPPKQLVTLVVGLLPWKIRHQRIKAQLHFLETAIGKGNVGGDGMESTGSPASLLPISPTRRGATAQEFPSQEFI